MTFAAQKNADSPAGLALTIAGNETTGGAGAIADLKTFHALDVFGAAALTCLVSFDPAADWGHRFVPVEAQVIADQLEANFANYTIDTVKIGMLGTPVTIDTVATALQGEAAATVRNLVLDPVLICKGQEPGAALDTDRALKAHILPLSTFVTPNHFEALTLSGMDSITSVADLTEAAKRIHDLAGTVVLAKGGVRLEGPDAVDVFYDGSTTEVLATPKHGEDPIHGAGCTLAAAVTAELAKGATPLEAARTAKAFVDAGIGAAVRGNRPFDILWQGDHAAAARRP